MRTIKFRGKTDTGEWVYGVFQAERVIGGVNYLIRPDTQVGAYGVNRIVIPETVGQFTGLYDINGVEIYEGDILQGLYCGVFFRLVYWDDALCGFALKDDYVEPIGYVNIDKFNYIVVGNEWDTPELLEVRE